jgi:hypothetical protein
MTMSREGSQEQQRPQEQRLSTADMAAASERRAEPKEGQTVVVAEPKPVARRAEDRPDQAEAGRQTPLFAGSEAEGLRGRWSDIQAGFVDEPRQAVEKADTLVAEVMQRLAQVFAEERQKLEQQWDRGGDTDTEELRQALRRYRSFFDRLLAM